MYGHPSAGTDPYYAATPGDPYGWPASPGQDFPSAGGYYPHDAYHNGQFDQASVGHTHNAHAAYGQPGGTPPQYGQHAYGQDSYGQHPYGQHPYGQDPYGQAVAYGSGRYETTAWDSTPAHGIPRYEATSASAAAGATAAPPRTWGNSPVSSDFSGSTPWDNGWGVTGRQPGSSHHGAWDDSSAWGQWDAGNTSDGAHSAPDGWGYAQDGWQTAGQDDWQTIGQDRPTETGWGTAVWQSAEGTQDYGEYGATSGYADGNRHEPAAEQYRAGWQGASSADDHPAFSFSATERGAAEQFEEQASHSRPPADRDTLPGNGDDVLFSWDLPDEPVPAQHRPQASGVDANEAQSAASSPPLGNEPLDVAPAAPRRSRRSKPKRSALLTVAAPSLCVLGVTAVAASAITKPGTEDSSQSEEDMPLAAAPEDVEKIDANEEFNGQLENLTAAADDYADRASRTQGRMDLEEQQALEQQRAEEEAARKEAERPKYALPVDQPGLSMRYNQPGLQYVGLHTGIDFPVNTGTPVRAATDGTVRTQWNYSYGNMAILTAPDGTETWYAHLSSTEYQSGEVQAGDVIAYSGNTGNSLGPHLHFEVRPGGGSHVDPTAWLRERGVEAEG